MRAKFINEYNFERNQSPKSSMNLGYGKYSEDVKRLNDLLSKKGFEIGSVKDPDTSKGIHDIAQWDMDNDFLVFFTFTNKLGEFYKKVFLDVENDQREMGMEEFITAWKKEYNIDESYNFERSGDPTSSMGIGMEDELNKRYGRQWAVIYKIESRGNHTPRFKGPFEEKIVFDTFLDQSTAYKTKEEAIEDGSYVDFRYLDTYKDFYALCDELGLPRPKYEKKFGKK